MYDEDNKYISENKRPLMQRSVSLSQENKTGATCCVADFDYPMLNFVMGKYDVGKKDGHIRLRKCSCE
jgi:hypothetical protein